MTGDHPAGGAEAALHDAALDAAVAVVDEIPDGAWDDPTPCSDWTVRAIVGHLAWGNLVLTGALRGAPFHDPAGGRTVVLPHPPPSAYRATVDEVRRALRAPGIPAAVAFPTGDLPLPAALRVRVQDLVVHLWDLSIATGTPLRVDDELIDAAYRTARERRAAGLLPAAQFAPPGDLTTACSPLDRLLLTVGRHPR